MSDRARIIGLRAALVRHALEVEDERPDVAEVLRESARRMLALESDEREWRYMPTLPVANGPWEVAWKNRAGDRGTCIAYFIAGKWEADNEPLPPGCVYAWREAPAIPPETAASGPLATEGDPGTGKD